MPNVSTKHWRGYLATLTFDLAVSTGVSLVWRKSPTISFFIASGRYLSYHFNIQLIYMI